MRRLETSGSQTSSSYKKDALKKPAYQCSQSYKDFVNFIAIEDAKW
jgi:hypothetical protein